MSTEDVTITAKDEGDYYAVTVTEHDKYDAWCADPANGCTEHEGRDGATFYTVPFFSEPAGQHTYAVPHNEAAVRALAREWGLKEISWS